MSTLGSNKNTLKAHKVVKHQVNVDFIALKSSKWLTLISCLTFTEQVKRFLNETFYL